MRYSTPELIVLGPASALVLGDEINGDDNGASHVTKPPLGVVLGLDD